MNPIVAGLLSVFFPLGLLHAKEVEVFNGRDLSGWTPKNQKTNQEAGKYWKVVDGGIIGDNPDKKNSILWTDESFGDFELTLEFKTESKDFDSGVFVRGESHQVQMGISRSLKVDLTGCIYAPVDGKGGYPATSDKVKEVHKWGEWNTMKIVVEGKRIRTWLNGEEFVDYTGIKIPDKGPIGLQLHPGVHQKMLFRKLKLTLPD